MGRIYLHFYYYYPHVYSLNRVKEKPSSSNIAETMPATPNDGDSGLSILFATQKTTQLADPMGDLANSGQQFREFNGMMDGAI